MTMRYVVILLSSLGGFASVAQAQRGGDLAGRYVGTCQAQYAGNQANPCQMTMDVDTADGVVIYGNSSCISPTDFRGVLFDDEADLRSGGWNAQPRGQTLALTFTYNRQARIWRAAGSGYGISDRQWTYRCSFRQQ